MTSVTWRCQPTGYRIARDPRLPSMRQASRGGQRPDPLGQVFEAEIVRMLEATPSLRPLAIVEEIVRRHSDLGIGIRDDRASNPLLAGDARRGID